ncbi:MULTISPECIES: hypothetical protein [Nostoc]|uniref:GHMP kinase N-terminal domain-containing protein n=1 Tax=Nostoc paludosum FACHB-159 TaxID=2692908 RepID=A0ABR8KKT3_9NOSO|nr:MULTISPECIES: hypothetical protein [Nostoc]MBD2683079.1 hypothetical protein [Nostoc sp. FACHB-857]MBD2739421.1 hypothetical protein [Nostoc paludosum FACHB-159]
MKLRYFRKDQERVEIVLDALISFAKVPSAYYSEFEVLEVKWENNSNILQVCTQKKDIQKLVKEQKSRQLQDWEVQQSIAYLRDLNIIKGDSQQGKKKLEFRVELWSKDKQTNLDKFRQLWKERKQGMKIRKGGGENPAPFLKHFEKALNEWKANQVNKGCIYSAPSAVFIGGEHGVVFGHSAIYYPLPLRLYVHIEPDLDRYNITINEYIVANPQNLNEITNIKLLTAYGDTNISDYLDAINTLFISIIFPFLRDKSGFRINVLSSFPIAVGLDSSGAFSVCLAQALVDHYINVEDFKNHFDIQNLDKNQVVLILAWAIENCSHGNCSSGAGPHASFYGRKGRHPLIYCTSRRSRLGHRLSAGWSPVNVGEQKEAIKNLLKIKTFIFDPAEPGSGLPSYPDPPPYNITVLYSGIFSKTKQALDKHSIRTYIKGSQKSVKYIHQKFNNIFTDKSFHRSVEIHTSEILGQIYLNDKIEDTKKDYELDFAYLELCAEALGNICISLVNSVLSDWRFVPDLMSSCQSLLSSMEYSHQNIDYFIAQLQANALRYEIDNKVKNDLLPKISAKLTGAGKGGDIIVFSLYEPDVHQELLEKSCSQDNVIHFDSYKMFSQQENASVEGVRQEK